MYRLVCTVYIPCTHVYIQIERHISRFILCSDQYTRTLCICIHDSNIVHQVYTLNVQVQVFMCIEYKSKKLLVSGFELTTLCRPLRCLNHCASRVSVTGAIVLVYIYCCTVRLSGAGPAAPPAMT